MTQLSELSDKKLNIYRYLSYWLYVLCTIGIPVSLIAWQFDIFKKPGGTQITAYGIILVIILVFICRGHIKRAVADMEISITRTVIINIGKLVPWLACWVILMLASNAATITARIQFVLFWTIIGNLIAMVFDIWHTELYKEAKRRENKNNEVSNALQFKEKIE